MVVTANFVAATVLLEVRLINLKPIRSILLKVTEHQLTKEMKHVKDGVNVTPAQKLKILHAISDRCTVSGNKRH